MLIPLGAAAFLSVGRHPIAGLAAAFAGVAAVFSVNFLITPLDGVLTEITNDAIHLFNPRFSIDLTANLYFRSCRLSCCRCLHLRHRAGRRAAARRHTTARRTNRECRRAVRRRGRGLASRSMRLIGVRRRSPAGAAAGRAAAQPGHGALIGDSPLMNSLIV